MVLNERFQDLLRAFLGTWAALHMSVAPQILMIMLEFLKPTTSYPGSLAGKESACNAEESSSIPGSGRSPGEGIGYPLQYFWASLVAQMVKNSSAMQETWVPSLGWEYLLEEGMATHSSILAWRIPMDRGAWLATVYGVTKRHD